jgi:hypothetical protein
LTLEIGKIIGQLWRELSDMEKSVYQQEYEAEKIEYERNIKAYQAALSNQHHMASRSRANTNVTNDGTAAIQVIIKCIIFLQFSFAGRRRRRSNGNDQEAFVGHSL